MGLSIGALLVRLHLDQTPEQAFVKPPLAANVLGVAPMGLRIGTFLDWHFLVMRDSVTVAR